MLWICFKFQKSVLAFQRVGRVVGLKPGSTLSPFKQTLLSSLTPSHTLLRLNGPPVFQGWPLLHKFFFFCSWFFLFRFFFYSPLSSAATTSRAKVNILQAPCVLGTDDAAILVLSSVQTCGGTKQAADWCGRGRRRKWTESNHFEVSSYSEQDVVDKAPLVSRPIFIQPHLPPFLRPCPAPGAPLVTLTLPLCPLPLTSARNREGPDFVAL